MATGWVNRHPPTEAVEQGLRIVGRSIRRGRLEVGMSQRVLERESGVDQSTISRLENGRLAGLRLTRFAAIVAALDRWGYRIDPTTGRGTRIER